MALAHVQFDVTDEDTGALMTNVSVRVELEGGSLVSIYEDRAGTTPYSNPQTFADGKISFYVAGGAYKITLTSGAFSRVLRYKPNGLLQEKDAVSAAAVAFTPAAGLVSTNVQAAIEEAASSSGAFSDDVQASGRFGLDNAGGMFTYQDVLAAGGDGVGVASRVQANFDYTGGTPGDVFSASWVSAEASAGVADYVWSFVAILDNYATAGENVAGYFQGKKQAGAGPTWSAVIDTKDLSTSNPASGVIGIEAAIFANGTDTSGMRVIADIVGGKHNAGGSDATISYGLRVGTSAGATISNGVRVEDAITNGLSISNTGSRGIKFEAASALAVGADFSAATFSAAAIRLAGGHYIAFDASDTGRLSYSSGALRYAFSGDEVFNLTDAGALTIDAGLTSGPITAASSATNVLASFTYTNDGAGFGPLVRYVRESASPAVDDGLGAFQFLGRTSTAAQTTYADVLASIVSPTNGATQGKLQFRTDTNGSAAARLTLQSGAQIGSPTGGDMGAGTLNLDNDLYKDGVKVVGARDTGWTAMTGTPDESTAYATGSVTLPQLAGRVMAMQTALTTHGLIGA